jgi:D-sorbitol dehydrogenase (acceptor)
LGGIDILVNSAGVIDIGPFEDIDQACWDRVVGTNCQGTLWCCQATAELMVARGQGGRIINIASGSGRRGEAGALVYCASKAAVISMTQSLALALAPHRINVNALAPGIIDTPMWDHIDRRAADLYGWADGEARRDAVRSVPLGRTGAPDDVASAALFLASPEAGYITQQCLNVDGGKWPS